MKIDMTSFFSAEGGPIWTKCRRLLQNDMSTAVMWSKSKPGAELIPIWRTFRRIQCHYSRARCYTAGCCRRANSVLCHPRATYHIAGCCHLVNSLPSSQSHIAGCSHLAKSMPLQGERIPSAILKIVFRHILFIFCF